MTLEDLIAKLPEMAETINGQSFVSARKIHEYLGVGAHYATWIANKIREFSLVEGTDYIVQYGKWRRSEHYIRLDTAPRFCVLRKIRSDFSVAKGCTNANAVTVYNDETAHIHTSSGIILLISPCDVEKVKRYRWYIGTRGYGHTEICGRSYTLSRYLMGLDNLDTGVCDAAYCVDHIDGDPVNNRRSNLRVCTPEQNRVNIQCRGYSRNPDGTYSAYIRVNKKLLYLGRARTEEAAQQLRRAAEIKYRGEFAPRRGKEWLAYAVN
ncbi:MAG: hypothetical protein HDQ88_01370 [Clostridia bacterium]|nr:hypothetical protein [Clostridia bacterium]